MLLLIALVEEVVDTAVVDTDDVVDDVVDDEDGDVVVDA
jgi:hypothetical protein